MKRAALGAPAREHRALHQLLGRSTSIASRRDAKVMDVGDMSVVYARVDPVWLRFTTPEMEAAFLKDAFHPASVLHLGQSLCMLTLLLAQWALHLARDGISPNTSFWASAPNQVLYRICIIFAYLSVRASLYLSRPSQRSDSLACQAFILINMLPRLYMIFQWLLSLRQHGWSEHRAATASDFQHARLDSPAGGVMVLTVFFFPITMQLLFCGPLTRAVMLLTAMASLMTPHGALPDDDSTLSLIIVHVVAAVAAHFVELVARVAYMRQAKLLVQMRQQLAADSKLNHLLKNKCAEARAEIEAVQDLADSPELVARLASVDALMEQTIQWTHRREVLLQLERGIYTSQLRPTVLRDAFKQVCGGRHARAEIMLEVDEVIDVDEALLKLLLEEGMSNAIKYRQPGTKLVLKATSQRPAGGSGHGGPYGRGEPQPWECADSQNSSSSGVPPPIQTPEGVDTDVSWHKKGLGQEPLELYVQLTNSNRSNVRTLTKDECTRAFVPGVTLDQKSTAASTGVGLHTVVLGVTSVGGRAWLSTETRSATLDQPAQALTTFHFTLPMREQVEQRKCLSLGKRRPAARGEGSTKDMRTTAAAAIAGKGAKPNAAAGVAIPPLGATPPLGGPTLPVKPTMVLEGLPFSNIVDRRVGTGDAAAAQAAGAWRAEDRQSSLARSSGGGGNTPESPPTQTFAPNEQESRDVPAALQGCMLGSRVGGGSCSTSSEATRRGCPSAEAPWTARGQPFFLRNSSNHSDEDLPTPNASASASLSDLAALSFSDVLMYALDDSAILRAYMLNVFRRMGAHPRSRALGADNLEVDSFVDVALGLAPPFVPVRPSMSGSIAPSSEGSSPQILGISGSFSGSNPGALSGSGLGLRYRAGGSGVAPRRPAPLPPAPILSHIDALSPTDRAVGTAAPGVGRSDSNISAGGAAANAALSIGRSDSNNSASGAAGNIPATFSVGRMADVVVLDYYIEMDDERVVNGGAIADCLRAKGFTGLIALFSGITRTEEAAILERGSVDIVIHKGSGPGAVQEQLTDAWICHRARRSHDSFPGSPPPEGLLLQQSPRVPSRAATFTVGGARMHTALGGHVGSPHIGSPGSGGSGRRARSEGGGVRARSAKTGGLLGQSARWF